MKQPKPGLMGAAALLAVTGLSACAAVTPEFEGYADGWRRARLEAVLDAPKGAATPASALPHQALVHMDCRLAPGAQVPQERHALVSYAYGANPKLRRYVVAPLPVLGEGVQLQPGQAFAVQVRHCVPLKALPPR
jgi:hypothetical protein